MDQFCKRHRGHKLNTVRQSLPEGGGITLLSCSKCAELFDKQEAERKQKESQNAIDKNLDNAMIAPRFKDRTFDNFKIENDGQGKAVKASRWFLQNIEQSMGLIMIGNPGTGKNHLASAILTEAVKKHGKTALFTETLKIIRKIKESWRHDGQTESQVIKSFIQPDILVIDEIGVQFGSETEKMFLTEIINDRYNHKKATILIGNVQVDELSIIIGERPLDRFREGGKVIVFDWNSYRKGKG